MNKSRLTSLVMILVLIVGVFLQSCIKTYGLDELIESQTVHDTIHVEPAVEAPPLIYGYVINFQGIHTVYGFSNKLACYGGNDMWGNFNYSVISTNCARLIMRWAWDSVVADYYMTFTSKNGGTYTGTLENVSQAENYGVWNTGLSNGPVSGSFTIYVP